MSPAPARERVSSEQFSALVERTRQKWIHAIMRKGFDQDTASDITSDAILNAWRFLHNFNGESALSTWVWTILFNQTREHLRRNQRQPRFEYLTQSLQDSAVMPESTTQGALVAQVLAHASKLPKREREVIHAYLEGGYNAPPQCVKILKHRAIIHLQKSILRGARA